ncbi:MAG: ABC transporter permease [Tissierellia bacterium]|nr:ABC transporter permease [Tissierellia bacterium]
MINTNLLISSIESGLIFSILSIGVVITFKILALADLSIEGVFPLGAFIFARFLSFNISPFIDILIAFGFGLIAGFLTYILYKKLKIEAILAGILTMTILYTVNLRIFSQSNVTLVGDDTIFSLLNFLPKVLILAIIVVIVKFTFDWFLSTEKGYLLLATGDNERLVKQLGEDPDKFTCLGFMLSNGLIALAGSLMAQSQEFVDITMGQTMIVNALASIIIGDTFLRSRSIKMTTRAIIGSIIYRLIYGIAIDKGLNPNDLKAITALIVIAFIVYNNQTEKFKLRKVLKNA